MCPRPTTISAMTAQPGRKAHQQACLAVPPGSRGPVQRDGGATSLLDSLLGAVYS